MTKHVPSPILRNISKTGKRKAGNEQMYLREKELNTGECHPTVDIQSYSEWRDEGSMVRLSFCSVQLFSCVWLFETPWTACQASLSITKSWRLLKVMSIELVMPSNHLILCPFSSCLQSFPATGSFQMSQFFTSGSQSIGVSASASGFAKNIQGWFPLGLTG